MFKIHREIGPPVVRLTKEGPFKLNKEQNTDLKKGTHIHICLL